MLDADFGRVQRQIFEADWARARPITLQAWRDRLSTERLQERLATLLHNQQKRGAQGRGSK